MKSKSLNAFPFTSHVRKLLMHVDRQEGSCTAYPPKVHFHSITLIFTHSYHISTTAKSFYPILKSMDLNWVYYDNIAKHFMNMTYCPLTLMPEF